MEPELNPPPLPSPAPNETAPAPAPDAVPAFKPKTWHKLLLLAVAVIGTLLLLEVAVRMMGFSTADMKETDTRTGLRIFKPSSTLPYRTSCFANPLTINSHGFHAPEYADEKASGTRRIVVVGDSFVESAQVPIEKSFSSLLQAKLNAAAPAGIRYEVIPFGIGGNGTLANLDYLAAYGLPAHPDLVIDAWNTSDVDNDASADIDAELKKIDDHRQRQADTGNARTLTAREYATAVLKGIAKKSALAVVMYSKYLSWKSTQDVGRETSVRPAIFEEKFYAEPTGVVTDAWDKQKRIFERMKSLAAANGANLAIVAMADSPRIPPLANEFTKQFSQPGKIVIDEPERTLGTISGSLGIPFYSMLPAFEERAPREGAPAISWACDAHYNETGHVWAADALFSYVTAHPELYAPHPPTP
jgi:hypothetical protein